MPENYLNLTANRSLIEEEKVRAKYEPEVAQKLLEMYNAVALDVGDGNDRYAHYYATQLIVVKDPKKADLSVRIAPEAEVGLAIAKQVSEARDKYPYTYKKGCEAVTKRLKKACVEFTYKGASQANFNMHHFGLFVDVYQMKGNERYTYDRAAKHESPAYVYSEQAVLLVVETMTRDPRTLDSLRSEPDAKKKRNRPQEQREF